MLADIDANDGDPATSREESIGFGGQNGYFTDSDTAAGLVCLGHRYYDPSTGRFINRDPIGYAGGENLYAFCGGNPVNEVDPEGNAPFSLPTDPSQLKALGWTRNAQRGGPNLGDKHQEWYAPDESWGLDFDRGTPGKPGFRGIDHYHVIRPVDGKTNKWVTVEDVPGSDRGHLEPGGDYDPATGKYLCPEKAEMAAMAEDVAYKARAKADEDARIRAENKRIEDDDYNYEHGGLPDGDPAYDNGSEGAGAGDNLPTENPTTEQNDGTPDE
jgi:RHS repeat-associated protein